MDSVEESARALDIAARPYFSDGRYGVWRAMESGQKLPRALEDAAARHHAAVMACAKERGIG